MTAGGAASFLKHLFHIAIHHVYSMPFDTLVLLAVHEQLLSRDEKENMESGNLFFFIAILWKTQLNKLSFSFLIGR